MAKVSSIKGKIFSLSLLVFVSILFYPVLGHSAVFNVTNGDELRDALSIAEDNGEDDIINLVSGLYRTTGTPFLYTTVEHFSLSIIGQDPELTKFLVPGGESSRILVIRTPRQGIKSNGNITVKNITIEGGFSANENDNGGGLFVGDFGIVTIENCEFRSNTGYSGGALSVNHADELILSNNNFIGNNAQTVGGGAHLSANDILIQNCLFQNNSSGSIEAGGSGGGAIISGFNVEVKNNIFDGNIVLRDEDGGGVEIGSNENLILMNNVFTNNFAGSFGGGASMQAKTATITENEFDNNTVGSVGGGFYIRADVLFAARNIVTNNTTLSESATGGGGASVFMPSSSEITNHASIINNLFKGNSTGGNGGGLYINLNTRLNVVGEIITITNNTLTLNETSKDGGGVNIYDTSNKGNTIGIYNNIIYDNRADGNGDDISIDDSIFTTIGSNINLQSNDFSDFFSVCENTPGCQPNINEGDNIDEDPLFVNAVAGDFSLQPDSPCIDAGDPDAPDAPDTDIFGNLRVPPPDMGAVEFIVTAVRGAGGCSIAYNAVSSSLAVFISIPFLLLIRRIVKRYRN